MRIVVLGGLPDLHRADGDAQLLMELAPQRLLDRFARLDLAAGELPVARIGLALGAGGQQQRLVFPADQDADGHLGVLARLGHAHQCLPA
jgi:hypothetical protein